MNFSAIDHHPMHLHGVTFWVTGTEGGRIQPSAWIPGNTVLVGVAQVREIEFIANNEGDWLLHCHMFHHVMNFMSSMIGPMGRSHRPRDAGRTEPDRWNGDRDRRSGSVIGGVRPEHGPEHGEQTGMDRTVGNMAVMPPGGGHGMGHSAGSRRVPGSPVGMLDMPSPWSEEQIRKLNKRETRGMRADWYTGVEGLFTAVRILRPDLYDAVMSGEADSPTRGQHSWR